MVRGEEGHEVEIVSREIRHARRSCIADRGAGQRRVAGAFDLFADPCLAQHVVTEKRRLVALVLDQLRVAGVRVHDLEVDPGVQLAVQPEVEHRLVVVQALQRLGAAAVRVERRGVPGRVVPAGQAVRVRLADEVG